MRLGVAFALLFQLHLEAAALLVRVVELAEGVGHFEAADVELKPLDGIRVVGLLLGERRDLGRKVVDEGRLHEVGFPQPLEDLGRRLARGRVGLELDSQARGDGIGARAVAQVGLGDRLAQPPAGLLGRGVPQREAPERRLQRDHLVVETDLLDAGRLAGCAGDELLGHRHQLVVVGVRLVELEHRELGVVLGRHALVPEVPCQLVHPLHAADDQAFQIELRRDAQIKLHVERVVMRDKRPRRRAAGNRLHHGRFDLDEAARVEERADGGHRLGAHLEDTARVGVDDQVEVPLPVARLDVLQAMPLFGKRQVALGEEHHAAGPDAELAGACPEQVPLDADVIAEIEQLEDLEIQFGQRVLPDVDLEALEAVGQPEKARLAEVANGQDAACRDRLDLVGVEDVGRAVAESADQRRDGVRAIEPPRIDVDAEGLKRLQVGPALLNLIVE